MTADHSIQPNHNTPVQRAKKCLREERYATVEGWGEIAVVSSLAGAPMVFLPEGGPEQVAVKLGELSLTCSAELISEEEVDLTGPRYFARHGRPKDAGGFALLAIETAEIDGASVNPSELLTAGDGDLIAYERRAVDHMNDDHLDAVKNYAEVLLGADAGEWRIGSLDMEGLDLVRCDKAGTDFRRLWFHPPLSEPGDIKAKLVELAMAGRAG